MSFIKILNDRFTGALYDENNFFRPTEIGTMGSDESTDTQYGPVCTYHMTASFKIRMIIDITKEQKKEPTATDDDNPLDYQWNAYKYIDFYNEWGVF